MGLKQEVDVVRVDVNDEYGVTLTARDVEPGGAEVQVSMTNAEARILAEEMFAAAAEAERYLGELKRDMTPKAQRPAVEVAEEVSPWS